MKIGIDMDSVIAEIIAPMVEFHNERYHTNLTVEDHVAYDLSRVWKCDPTDVLSRIFEYYESPFFDKVQPVPGSQTAIRHLSRKHELILITSRPYVIEQKTREWLRVYFPGMFKKICHTNQVSRAHEERKRKSQVCRDEGISLMIDDAVDYALDCAEAGIQVYLFPALWNRKAPVHKRIQPVRGWDEIITLL